MGDAVYIFYVIAVWAACSLIMTFFSVFLEKYADMNPDETFKVAAFGPFSLAVFIIVMVFVAFRIASKKVFG